MKTRLLKIITLLSFVSLLLVVVMLDSGKISIFHSESEKNNNAEARVQKDSFKLKSNHPEDVVSNVQQNEQKSLEHTSSMFTLSSNSDEFRILSSSKSIAPLNRTPFKRALTLQPDASIIKGIDFDHPKYKREKFDMNYHWNMLQYQLNMKIIASSKSSLVAMKSLQNEHQLNPIFFWLLPKEYKMRNFQDTLP